MSEIIPQKLYLSDMYIPDNIPISAIICVADRLKIENKHDVPIFTYKIDDQYDFSIYEYFDEITELIQSIQGPVVVNCVAGISRSATIVIAYLMRYYGMDLRQAFVYTRSKRRQICPNKGFMKCLRDYEVEICGYNSMTEKECTQLFYYSD